MPPPPPEPSPAPALPPNVKFIDGINVATDAVENPGNATGVVALPAWKIRIGTIAAMRGMQPEEVEAGMRAGKMKIPPGLVLPPASGGPDPVAAPAPAASAPATHPLTRPPLPAVARTTTASPVAADDAAPPHDLEAETCVLGSILLDPARLAEVSAVLSPDGFWRLAHAEIYRAMLALRDAGRPLDLVILRDELARSGKLSQVGGAEYLAALTEAVPSPSNAGYYSLIVADRARRRLALRVTHDLAERFRTPGADLAAVAGWGAAALDGLTDAAAAPAAAAAPIAVVDARDLIESSPPRPLPLLDNGGLIDAGELALVTGPPGSGKSILLVNLACAVAAGREFFIWRAEAREPAPVLLVLAEYGEFRAYERIEPVARHYAVPRGMLNVWHRDRDPHFIDLAANGGARAGEVAAYVRTHGVRLVAIDSLSETHAADENDRTEMVGVVRALRAIAAAGAAVVALHHVRKQPAGPRGGGGWLDDVRGSSALTAALASALSCRRDAEAGEGGAGFIATWIKTNYALPEHAAVRYRTAPDSPGLIVGMEPVALGGRPGLADEDLMDAMQALGGRNLSLVDIAAAAEVSPGTARKGLRRLVAAGKIPPAHRAASKEGKGLWSLRGGPAEAELPFPPDALSNPNALQKPLSSKRRRRGGER